MNPFSLSVREAIDFTAEILSIADYTQLPMVRCQNRLNPEVWCQKDGCTNGKHYGYIGQIPNRVAIIWFDEIKEENNE